MLPLKQPAMKHKSVQNLVQTAFISTHSRKENGYQVDEVEVCVIGWIGRILSGKESLCITF